RERSGCSITRGTSRAEKRGAVRDSRVHDAASSNRALFVSLLLPSPAAIYWRSRERTPYGLSIPASVGRNVSCRGGGGRTAARRRLHQCALDVALVWHSGDPRRRKVMSTTRR